VTFAGVAYLVSGGVYAVITLVVGGFTVDKARKMMREAHGEYSRGELISHMSQIEMLTLLMFLLAFGSILGEAWILIFIASGAWVVSMNKSLWGTYIAPRV
jgi:hypothetical protein